MSLMSSYGTNDESNGKEMQHDWKEGGTNMMKLFKYPEMVDRIPSTTPGAEPPRDARDSGSARSHSTHLETSSSDRP